MSDEYKAIRYAALISSNNEVNRITGYQNLLDICNKLGWTYYQDELITNIKNDKAVQASLYSKMQSNAVNRKSSSSLDTIDSYFTNLNPKNIQSETFKIKDNAKKYYEVGNFSQYITVFNRFIVALKNDIQETELHSFMSKFVIASAIKRQYDLAISEISKLKQHYHNYDISVYVL